MAVQEWVKAAFGQLKLDRIQPTLRVYWMTASYCFGWILFAPGLATAGFS